MSRTTLRVTVVQDLPFPRDLAANAATIERVLRESDADVVVFPELFLSGYQTQHLEELQLTTDHPLVTQIADTCRDLHRAALIGFTERGDSGPHNAYLAIDRDGTVLPAIRKTHLFGAERDTFVPGDRIEPITLAGVRAGVVNCFELEFPEIARTLALRGAEVLLAGSANMHPYLTDHQIATHARAIENRLPLVYANRIGHESGHHFCGGSRAVSADGEILAQFDTEQRGSFTVDLTLGTSVGDEVQLLGQRQPELYA
jgi:predicted amidohydrolase